MKLFISTYEDMILGGGETYYFRMVSWLNKHGYVAYLLVPHKCEIDRVIEKEAINRNVCLILYRNIVKDEAIKKILTSNNCEDIIAIVYTKERYARLVSLFNAYRVEARVFLYIISPNRAVLKQDWNISRNVVNQIFKPICGKNGFAVMDNDYVSICSQYAGLDKNSIKMIPVGVDIEKILSAGKKKDDSRNFTILTVARFDFPLKGYIIGLIKDFAELYKKYEDVELIIVGYGQGKNVVDSELSKLDDDVLEKIHIKGKVEYSKLLELYKKADAFVGMGTTLLEAAKAGTISIVASGGQYENFSSGYFDEAGTVGFLINGRFSKYSDIDKHKRYHFIDLLEEVYLMSTIEYERKSLNMYNTYVDTYSIDNVMPFFLEQSNGGLPDLSLIQKMLYTFFDWKQRLIINLKFIKRKYVKKE